MPKNTPNTMEDFWALVFKTDTCWLWVAGVDTEGYGQFMFQGRRWLVHRLSYSQENELIKGLVLDHSCEVRRCVNPLHLDQVTDRVNILKGKAPTAINARKTHCKRGHEFTPENTYRYKDGRRDCKTCMSVRMKEYYNQHKNEGVLCPA